MKKLSLTMTALLALLPFLAAQNVEYNVQQKATVVRPVSSAQLQDQQLRRQAAAQEETRQAQDRQDLTKQDPRLRAAVQAVLAAVNRRLPADKAITMDEIAQDFKAAMAAPQSQ